MKSTQTKLSALLLGGILSYTGVAYAVPSATLASLAANPANSVNIGDKTFSGFTFNASNLAGFNAANILVTASVDAGGVYYLTWGGNMNANLVGPGATADLLLNYTVTASAGLISMIDQSYTGSGQGGGFLAIDETVRNTAGAIVAKSTLDLTDIEDPFAEVGDDLDTAPGYSVLRVTKDIGYGSGPGATFISLSEVKQSFHQQGVPEGGMTIILLGGALSALGLARRMKFLS